MTSNRLRPTAKLSSEDFVKYQELNRNRDISEYLASPILSEQQWSIYIKLKRELASRDLTVLVGVPFTAIIDPVHHKLSDSLWRSSVLFAVMTMSSRGMVRLLVSDTVNAEMEQCLDKLQVAHISYNHFLNELDFVKVVLDEIDFQFANSVSAKQLINKSEHEVAESFRKNVLSIEYERLFANDPSEDDIRNYSEISSLKLLQEVALHRICNSNLIDRRLSPEEERFRGTSSVDFLVHAPPPLGQPLLVLEFDGPIHDEHKKQKKDQLKNAILERYGLPLIRISYTDAAFGSHNKHEKREQHHLFVKGLWPLVNVVLGQKQLEFEFLSREEAAQKKLNMLEDDIAKSSFGKSYVYLTEDQQRQVAFSTMAFKEAEELQEERSLYGYLREQTIERANEMAEWPKSMEQYAERPLIFGDQRTGFWAEFTVKLPNCQVKKFELPKIWIQIRNFDEELFMVQIKGVFNQMSADFIQRMIRRHTPASRI